MPVVDAHVDPLSMVSIVPSGIPRPRLPRPHHQFCARRGPLTPHPQEGAWCVTTGRKLKSLAFAYFTLLYLAFPPITIYRAE